MQKYFNFRHILDEDILQMKKYYSWRVTSNGDWDMALAQKSLSNRSSSSCSLGAVLKCYISWRGISSLFLLPATVTGRMKIIMLIIFMNILMMILVILMMILSIFISRALSVPWKHVGSKQETNDKKQNENLLGNGKKVKHLSDIMTCISAFQVRMWE